MTSVKKPFDQKMFNKTDLLSREAVRGYVGRSGLYVRDNPDIYGADLIVYKGFKPLSYIEVEVKLVWKKKQDVFPWKTIQLPERKAKFLNQGLPIEFFILREDYKMAVVIPDYAINSTQLEEVKNKYVSEGEKFYKINIEECQVISLEEDKDELPQLNPYV